MRMYQKMMKSVCVLVLLLAGSLSVGAVPAHPRPADIKQSDGTVLTVKLVGDEFHHYSSTTDGYTVVQRSNGDYVYAVESGARLVPSTVIAHNPQMRDATEQRMVSGLQKGLTDKISMAQGTRMRSNRDQLMAPAKTDYQHFRGLVVLIEYNDRSFTYGNDYFDDMMNQENYTGYYSRRGILYRVLAAPGTIILIIAWACLTPNLTLSVPYRWIMPAPHRRAPVIVKIFLCRPSTKSIRR